MPDRTTQERLDKFDALLDLITSDGATVSGEVPATHVAALRDLDDVDRERIEEIVTAHRNSNPPPQ